MRKEALLYEKLEQKAVQCFLCCHQCHIAEGKFGFCGARQNIEGALYTYAYGKVIAAHVDPIEKKPLYHFLPGSSSFSIATIGCNFRCGFCQNWEISQLSFRDGDILGGGELSPKEAVREAITNRCRSISYTYTEPTIFFEYALDIAKIAKTKGLRNIFVTNGYMTADALHIFKPYLDAANIDLKFFRDSSYKKVCAGRLRPVLDSIHLMRDLGVWFEITTLIVPGENDSKEELRDIAGFIAGVSKNIPWHVLSFHPDYKFTGHQPTPEESLKAAVEIGRESGLTYIYAGNTHGWGNDTYCHNCKKLIIKRDGFRVLGYNMKENKCAFCNTVIPGVFMV